MKPLFFQFCEVRLGFLGPCVPPLQNLVPAPSSALPGPCRAEPPVPASARRQVPGRGPPHALVTWMVGGQGSGGRGRPSTLAVPVYMQACGAGLRPASPLQQIPRACLPAGSCSQALPPRHYFPRPSQPCSTLLTPLRTLLPGAPTPSSNTGTAAWQEPGTEALL